MNTATLTRKEARTDLYPSRGGLKGNIVPRNHPTVWASATTQPPVERSLVEQYERDGFLVLRDIFTPEEVSNLQAELDRLRSDAQTVERPEIITEKGSRQVRSIFKVHALSEVFARLAADQRLAGLASYLLGDDVYLHQSRLNYKPGFHGKEFYWHSDFETWHVEDGMPLPRALSISVSLTDNTPHNGPLLVMPGSHKRYVVCEGETPPDNYQMSLKAQETGVPSDENLTRLAEMGGLVDTAGPAGSVLIFDSNLMHGSNSNITHLPRSNAFFVYNALSNAVEDPFCDQPPRPEFIATRENISPLDIRKNSADDFRPS
ncbi:ectoine hydroxylase [Achromobacter sp. F4_2707]|uniref:ectoine hydroxylase n=1 Tax=Achromobacter sp. F4_2707 TaxID=3114286 RepID=UPI0039C5DF40